MSKLISAFAILSFCAAVSIDAQSAETRVRYYRSNQSAMRLEPLAASDRGGLEYVLAVRELDGYTSETLLRDGEPIEELRLIRGENGLARRERYRDGVLVRRTDFGPRGLPSEAEIFREGELVERRVFSYDDDRLLALEVSFFDGRRNYTERYAYRFDGRLRRVDRLFENGERRISEYSFAGDRLLDEWHGREGEGLRLLYDEAGRLVRQEEWREGELAVFEEFSFENGSIVESRRVGPGERTREREYEDGRLVSERVYTDGILQAQMFYRYQDGLLVEENERGGGEFRVRRYEYDDEDNLVEETLRRNGELVERIRYQLEEGRVVIRYRNGEAFVRSYFSGEERLRDEFLEEGIVVRVEEAGE